MLRAEGMDTRILKCFGEPILQFWQDPERVRDLSICMQRQCSGRVERRATAVKKKRKTRKKMRPVEEADAEAEDTHSGCSSSPSSALSLVAAGRRSCMRRRRRAVAPAEPAVAEATETAEGLDGGTLDTIASQTLAHAAYSSATRTSSVGAAPSCYTDSVVDYADSKNGMQQTFLPEFATSGAPAHPCGNSRFVSSTLWPDGLASLSAWGCVADAAAGGLQHLVNVQSMQSFTFAKPLEHEFFAFSSASPFSLDTANALTLPLTSAAASGLDNDTEFASLPLRKIQAGAAENTATSFAAPPQAASDTAASSLKMLPAAASVAACTPPAQCAAVCPLTAAAAHVVADSAAGHGPPVVPSCASAAATAASYPPPFSCAPASAEAAESIGASHGLRNWTHDAVGRVDQPGAHATAVETNSTSSAGLPSSFPHLSSAFSVSSSCLPDASCAAVTASAFAFPSSAASIHEAPFGSCTASFASRFPASAAAWDDSKLGSATKTGDARHGVRGRKRRRKQEAETQSSVRPADEETACCSTAALKEAEQQAMQACMQISSTLPTSGAQSTAVPTDAVTKPAPHHTFLLNPEMIVAAHADTLPDKKRLHVTTDTALYKSTDDKIYSEERCIEDGYRTTKGNACSGTSSLRAALCTAEAAENTLGPLDAAATQAHVRNSLVKHEEGHVDEGLASYTCAAQAFQVSTAEREKGEDSVPDTSAAAEQADP